MRFEKPLPVAPVRTESMDEYPFVLGSAGHIDHGKTTLVRALTGVDCDRLEEEKRRGITIELGFAPLALPSGRIVSIVDVPGHERFIRQMVAGSAGIDAVMLVVAADEGVMPQTREHLDILKLLGVTNGLVVIAKSDLVDDDLLDLAAADVRALTEGTFLEKAPLLFVSSILGTGLDSLITEIDSLVTRTPPRNRSGAFFMPIDRAFGIKGFGSIVTGTSFHGTLREGEEVDIVPAGLRSRVRSIQIHKAATKGGGGPENRREPRLGVPGRSAQRRCRVREGTIFPNRMSGCPARDPSFRTGTDQTLAAASIPHRDGRCRCEGIHPAG